MSKNNLFFDTQDDENNFFNLMGLFSEQKKELTKWARWAKKRVEEKILSGKSIQILEHNKEFRESFYR